NGTVVSDWGALVDRVEAERAGLDPAMPPTGTDDRIDDAVNKGELDATVLDTVVERLMRLKEIVGIETNRLIDHQAHQEVARQAAAEALVLLKNDGDVLPLVPGRSVAVIGEFARTPRYQGGGSSHMVPTRVSSALEAFEEVSGEFPVRFAPGFTLDGTEAPELVDEAVTLAADAHTTVLFLGLPEAWESEGFDRTDITLPAAQRELLARVRRVSSRV